MPGPKGDQEAAQRVPGPKDDQGAAQRVQASSGPDFLALHASQTSGRCPRGSSQAPPHPSVCGGVIRAGAWAWPDPLLPQWPLSVPSSGKCPNRRPDVNSVTAWAPPHPRMNCNRLGGGSAGAPDMGCGEQMSTEVQLQPPYMLKPLRWDLPPGSMSKLGLTLQRAQPHSVSTVRTRLWEGQTGHPPGVRDGTSVLEGWSPDLARVGSGEWT